MEDEGAEGGGFFLGAPLILSTYMGETDPIVLDTGSGFSKGGYAGYDNPRSIFRSVLAIRRPKSATDKSPIKSFSGDDSLTLKWDSKTTTLSYEAPIERGVIKNFDLLEKLWDHAWKDEVRVDPGERSVLLTESPFNPKASREKMAQLLFEKFRTPSLFIANSSALALFSTGTTTGVVLDSGDGVTTAVPIAEGSTIEASSLSLNVAGEDITQIFQKALVHAGSPLDSALGTELVRHAKHKLSYVALDFEAEDKKSPASVAKKYELPDGKSLTVGVEQFRGPEILFNTALVKSDAKVIGIHKLISDSVLKCEETIRSSLFGNVVLAGGATATRGLPARLEKELKTLVPAGTKLGINTPPSPQYASWLGGSIIGSLSLFQSLAISKQDYQETGASLFLRKIF